MAEVASKDILLYVNLGTAAAPDWRIIGCSTTDGFSGTTEAVAIATKCNGGFVNNRPGDKSWSFSNSSYLQKDYGPEYATWDEIMDLWINDTKDGEGLLCQWKLESIDPQFDFYLMGRGFISDVPHTADNGDYLTRDLTITGSGEITNVETT